MMSAVIQLERLMERFPVLEVCREDIWKAFEVLKRTYEKSGMLLVCGNGGSGADSEHIVGELMKEFAIKRPLSKEEREKLEAVSADNGKLLGEHLQGSLPAIPLTGNIALSTAFANDAVPELVFAQQVYGYGNPNSSLMGISTSGNSRNVIYAIEVAKAKGMETIGLTGEGGGQMKQLCDVCICVPASCTPDIQELHLPVYHALCRMVEEEFFG
ncbi:MAG: SIS domain-containing protein [Eisenbergiella sp.]|nr:SIS domain-containing protein [Bacillota bacterium]